MSRKLTLSLLLVSLVSLLLLCSTALAYDPFPEFVGEKHWTHGNYTATTDACAGCHVAHSATVAALLKVGVHQTEFCMFCHDGSKAPYNVFDGMINGDTEDIKSTAGGFEYIGTDPVTSRHKVVGFETNSSVYDLTAPFSYRKFVPGGTNEITAGKGFVCGSCHDPHAGGPLGFVGGADEGLMVDGGANHVNPRLLRKSLLGGTSNLKVRFDMENVGTFGEEWDDAPVVYRVVGYASGVNAWCGGCHDKLVVGAGFGGRDGIERTMYRHAVGVYADLDQLDEDGRNFSKLEDSGTPLEGDNAAATGKGNVACLTCHRAHGTTATVTSGGWAETWAYDGGSEKSYTVGEGSALLRMDNRGVCWACHDAARYNSPSNLATP